MYPRRSADDGKALAQLEDGVGEPAIRRQLADIDDPLPEYCRIDQRVAPELFGDVRPGARQGTQRGVTDQAKRGRDHRDEIVIHPVQMQTLEIRNITGDMD